MRLLEIILIFVDEFFKIGEKNGESKKGYWFSWFVYLVVLFFFLFLLFLLGSMCIFFIKNPSVIFFLVVLLFLFACIFYGYKLYVFGVGLSIMTKKFKKRKKR
ncbi:hypothetical protein IGI96_001755 [Enterococcus sp. DIV0421]